MDDKSQPPKEESQFSGRVQEAIDAAEKAIKDTEQITARLAKLGVKPQDATKHRRTASMDWGGKHGRRNAVADLSKPPTGSRSLP